jgi:hypothetical protein
MRVQHTSWMKYTNDFISTAWNVGISARRTAVRRWQILGLSRFAVSSSRRSKTLGTGTAALSNVWLHHGRASIRDLWIEGP